MLVKSLRLVSVFIVAALTLSGAVTAAQSTPEASVEELEQRIAELEEENEQLKEENDRLRQRIEDMSGPSRTPRGGADEAAAETAPTLAIGETWEGDVWSITATYVEYTPTLSSSFETNTARGLFVIVHLTVVNNGTGPAPFPYDEIVLKDADGRSYTAPWEPLFNLTFVVMDVGSTYDDMQPGIPYQTGIIFDIPATATGLQLTSSKEAFWIQLD